MHRTTGRSRRAPPFASVLEARFSPDAQAVYGTPARTSQYAAVSVPSAPSHLSWPLPLSVAGVSWVARAKLSPGRPTV